MIEVAAICEVCKDDFAHGDDADQVRRLVQSRGGFVDPDDRTWCPTCAPRRRPQEPRGGWMADGVGPVHFYGRLLGMSACVDEHGVSRIRSSFAEPAPADADRCVRCLTIVEEGAV